MCHLLWNQCRWRGSSSRSSGDFQAFSSLVPRVAGAGMIKVPNKGHQTNQKIHGPCWPPCFQTLCPSAAGDAPRRSKSDPHQPNSSFKEGKPVGKKTFKTCTESEQRPAYCYTNICKNHGSQGFLRDWMDQASRSIVRVAGPETQLQGSRYLVELWRGRE